MPGGPVAYVATTLRNEATMQLFMQTAEQMGLAVQQVSCGGDAYGHHTPVQFQQVAALREQRQRVLVHRLQLL